MPIPCKFLHINLLQLQRRLFHHAFITKKPTTSNFLNTAALSSAKYTNKYNTLIEQQQSSSCSKDVDIELLSKCQLEFISGAGGWEAALFARELYDMYKKYALRNDWKWRHLESDMTKGLRSAIVFVEGDWCYAKLRFEGGVHRVQRQPVTDKLGKIHTSTVSLVVLPEPEKPEVMFGPNEIKLETMRSSGAGGANVNANSTAVRLTHIPTGISVKAQDERYLQLNEKIARKRLSALLLKRQVDEINQKYSGIRELQVSSMERYEKIRTYNFKDKRVTDHRLKHSIMDVEGFLEGNEKLEEMIEMLMELYEREEAEQKENRIKSNKLKKK